MTVRHEAEAFLSEEIRDTNSHNSSVIENIGYSVKTIIIENHLNQEVSFQCQGSRNGLANWFEVGNGFNVSANTDIYQTCDAYFPYMRLTAQPSIAPTTGDLSVFFERIREE